MTRRVRHGRAAMVRRVAEVRDGGGASFVVYPTFARAAKRPRWIAVLVIALSVAAGFAWLGQWQLARAVETAFVQERDTETVKPLASVLPVGDPMTDDAVDRMISATGVYQPGDFLVVSDRANGSSTGYWVVGCLKLDAGGSAAVAIGWAADRADATAVADRLNAADASTDSVTVTGRLTASEAVDVDTTVSGNQGLNRMAISWIVNVWAEVPSPIVQGYIVSHDVPPAGLTPISSPKPDAVSELNWLNLFYAIEWVVFSGFALFLWWRLVSDEVRREREDLGFIPLEDDDEIDDDATPTPATIEQESLD